MRWDNFHFVTTIFVHRGDAPEAVPRVLLAGRPKKRNSCSTVAMSSAVAKSGASQRLTVGDHVMLVRPCAKSGLEWNEVGVICKDDKDSKPYKVSHATSCRLALHLEIPCTPSFPLRPRNISNR